MGKVILGIFGAFVLLIVILIIAAVGTYNGLVNRSQAVDAQWAQVQNVYQRRTDLIPNLVNTVSGAANFEKTTLMAVTEARASVGKVQLSPTTAPTDPTQLAQFEQAQGQLSSALSRLLVVVERYPELKATQNFQMLQAQLEGTENRITVARNRYIQAVQDYNVTLRSFPTNITAMIFKYSVKPNFTVQNEAQISRPPTVDFGNSGAPAGAAPAAAGAPAQ